MAIFEPCCWPMVYPCAVECTHLDSLQPTAAQAMKAAAVDYLWEATGRRYGLCEVTARPCSSECADGSTYQGWSGAPAGGLYGWYGPGGWWGPMPYLSGGQWFNASCCGGGGCDTSHMDYIELPGPVHSVLQVYINGSLFTDWVLDSKGLGRTDGHHWPREQKQALPLTDNQTFGVIYERGLAVPAGGQVAAGLLACEMAKYACGDGSCRLPKRVTNVRREGVDISFVDDFAMLFAENATGIPQIDLWLASVNRSARKRSRVLSPDARPTRRTF